MKKVLSFEMTIAEWIGSALILAAPYALIGLLWTVLNLDQMRATGILWVIQLVGSIVSWPAMVFSAVCAG
ncbi:hypothetical protein [Mycolicibacterium phlei]